MKKITALLTALLMMLGCVSAMAEAAEVELPALLSTWALVASADDDGNITNLTPETEDDLYVINFYKDNLYGKLQNGAVSYGGYAEDKVEEITVYYLFPIDDATGELSETPAEACFLMASDILCIPQEAEDGSISYLYFTLFTAE